MFFQHGPLDDILESDAIVGSAAYLEDTLGMCDIYMSKSVRGTIRDGDHMSAATCSAISRSLDEQTGPLVRRLAIGSFFKLSDIIPYPKYCPNLEAVDFSKMMHAIDADDRKALHYRHKDHGLDRLPVLTWFDLLTSCTGLFAHLKLAKLQCNGPPRFRENVEILQGSSTSQSDWKALNFETHASPGMSCPVGDIQAGFLFLFMI